MAEGLARQLQLQRSIDRALENFKKLGKGNLTPAKIRSRIVSVKEAWQQFLDGHVALLRSIPESSRSTIDYFKDEVFEATEDNYQGTLDYMTESLEELDPPVSHSTQLDLSHVASPSTFSLVHLPPIRLPPFDGSLIQWENFRDRFKALIIENRELNDFACLHFLTSCLTGRARDCIAKVATTADNFEVAWKTLVDRYESKRRLLHSHLTSLFNMTVLQRESASDLAALRDRVNLAVASLENLQRTPKELWNDALVHIVVQCLDPATRKAWTIRISDCDEPPSFDDLNRFLAARSRALEELAPGSNTRAALKPVATPRVCASTALQSDTSTCPMCKLNHSFSSCPSFTRATPTQRHDLVKQHRRCFNCLSYKHSARDGTSKYSCRRCQRKHHSMLHLESESGVCDGSADPCSSSTTIPRKPSMSSPLNDHESSSAVNSLSASAKRRSFSQVLLATAWVTIISPSGRSVTVRALLDQGSEVTFVAENIAQTLHLKRIKMPVSVSAVGGLHAGVCNHAVKFSIASRKNGDRSLDATAYILKKLTSYAPKHLVTLASYSHLHGLPFADPDPTNAAPINLILGADLYNDIILEGLRKGDIGQPIAQKTIFGWVVSGPTESSVPMSDTHAMRARSVTKILSSHLTTLTSLEQEIKKFWALEEIPRKEIVSEEDAKCEEHFRQTHSRASDGRYIVRLPFKQEPSLKIGDSRGRAEKCLASLLNRLRSRPQQLSEYTEFLDEYERLGHMRPAKINYEITSQSVYIPHHAVFREGSATSPLRVVFNASSPTTNGSSLNDHLLTGPKLQNDITAVILKWRQYQYVYTAGIAKMYRQIRLDVRDVDYQRILWNSTPENKTTDYQLLTVTYGMTCAPFLALRALKQLASDEGAEFPLASSIVRNHIYVDDCIFGGDDAAQLVQTREQLVALLRRGGFELRKWASNSPALLSGIDPANHGLACKTLAADERLQILGLAWDPTRDSFQVKVSRATKIPDTKRSILSAIAKCYDPLGWITPAIITSKILMQCLWRENLGWDDPLPASLLARWHDISSQFSSLTQIQLPRWTAYGVDTHHAELHGFADASNVAYAAVVYLKVVSTSGQVTISLLAGKSRVAPLRPLTIPRLELSAALLLARLIEHILSALEMLSLLCFCWTDSTVVLSWLHQHPSRWRTFVANRVAEIQALLPGVEWRHVATDHNPADCASRGLLGSELLGHSLWWSGPAWLRQSREEWPSNDDDKHLITHHEEHVVSSHGVQLTTTVDLASRFSSWARMLRVTAYLFRFVNRCRRRPFHSQESEPQSLALTAAECSLARKFWLKQIQADLFSPEIIALSNDRALLSNSAILSLTPFVDSDGLLRVGGRLRHAAVPQRTRQPVILAAHPLVRLLIEQAHQRSLHAGLQLTLSTLRQEFWILRARTLVKAAIHSCVVCTRERAEVPTQLMGDLPSVRVKAPGRSFQHCGLDYAGPLLVRASAGRGITCRKAYIALFICLATRAIHLELVSDYSTPAFLNAFVRFSSRRGLPASVYSDNGTTFVEADRELTSAY